MRHRDVRVSLYGIVAGVILGAGALALTQHAAVQANTISIIPPEVLLHGAPSRVDFTQRNISRKDIPLRGDTDSNIYPTVRDPAQSSSSSVEISPTTCGAVKKAIEKIHAVYNAVVPNTLKNTEIRQSMDAVFSSADDDACGVAVGSSPAASAATGTVGVATVDNNCEKFQGHSVRRSQCEVAEKNGKTYP